METKLPDEKLLDKHVDALDAMKWNDFTGEREADHQTRKPYHDKLGRLLGLESDRTGISITGDKVIAILGGATSENVYGNHSDPETPTT
mgnify:CR=1 FL=1